MGPEFGALLLGWFGGLLWFTAAWPLGLLPLFAGAVIIGTRGGERCGGL
jgi:hypothetical protein